ncbi:hypothetical protein [Frigoribacterium sp. PhB160]|uniref:hypothetical protein n=1 Tax=Frigoribacterium sp. PhB160 TaxID=2485192 RepID=UPI0011CD59B1|nr:hypothetical protein [Frigoribacterium sp. PhB160]
MRYPKRVDRGTEVTDYTAVPDELDIKRCWYEPTSSVEDTDARSAVLTGYTVDAPSGADIVASDHVRIAGVEHEVDGQPLDIPSPTGVLDSVRLTTKRWEG